MTRIEPDRSMPTGSSRNNRAARRVGHRWCGAIGLVAGGLLWLCCLTPATVAAAEKAARPELQPVPEDGNLPLSSARFSGGRDYGDLALYGYSEQEYYISGIASVRNQDTGAIELADLPYTSRVLVRKPLNPKAFSGNVIIEPFHAIYDKNDMWRQTHSLITRNGDAWVGITVHAYSEDQEPTAQYSLGGVPMLKVYDAERYGRLNLYPDHRGLPGVPVPVPPQAFDLMVQLASLIKANDPSSPLKGLVVKKLYSMGAGASGEVIVGLIRSGMNDRFGPSDGKPLFNGFMVSEVSHFVIPEPKNAALIVLRSESVTDRAASFGYLNVNPDTPAYRVYNAVGVGHLNARNRPDDSNASRQMNAVLPKPEANMPYLIDPTVCPNIDDEPVDTLWSAMLNRLELWGKNGTALPAAPPIETLPGDAGAQLGDPNGGFAMGPPPPRVAVVKRDPRTGNAMGGLRMPWIEAPVAMYPVQAPGAGGPPGAGDPPGAGGPPGAAGRPAAGQFGEQHAIPDAPVVIPSDAWPRGTKTNPKLAIKGPVGGSGPCFLYNPRIPFDKATLRKLYRSYDEYVAKFEGAKSEAVKAGYLLPEDALILRPRGDPTDF